MAHAISISNGFEEAAFARQPAWHGLGTVLPDVPDSETMIQAAHLNWTVERQPLQTSGGIEIPDHFATVRTDTSEPLGVVGSRYQIVQNREAFGFLDGLLQDGIMRYESAGALDGGRRVWALARMPSVDEIAPGDKSYRYVLFSTSHDGTASLQAIPTSVRVVCANTLAVATAGSVGIRHTGDVAGKLDQARLILSQFDEKFTLFRDHGRHLASRKYSQTEAVEYVHKLFPEPGEDASQRSWTIHQNKLDRVRQAFRSEANSIPQIKGSWWQLLNAVTEAQDHTTYRGRRLSTAKAERRFVSAMDGTASELKRKAWKLALEMAG